MQEVIDEVNWAKHDLLSKLLSHSDYDGWYSYFTIKQPTLDEVAKARQIVLEYSTDGVEWSAAQFSESVSFVNFVSFGWDRSTAYDNAENHTVYWRATLA